MESAAAFYYASVIPACFWSESSGLPQVAIRLLAQLLQVHRGTISGLSKLDEPIGVGTAHWLAPPLPPNRTGGSPASGSPVGGFTSRGLEQSSMGFYKAEKPMIPKEAIWPAMMIVPTADALVALVRLRRMLRRRVRIQPSIGGKVHLLTVFEVFKPAPQGAVDIGDDRVTDCGRCCARSWCGWCP